MNNLVPIAVKLSEPLFTYILGWQHEDEFVSRILANDIPHRVVYQQGSIWAYRDEQKNIVGFGTLSICDEYREFTDGFRHSYIPLLAVKPDQQGKGYGRAIVGHLTHMAACYSAANPQSLHHAVFLDVYEESVKAKSLYEKCGFQTVGDGYVDSLNNRSYRVMAKRVSTPSQSLFSPP